ncbi:MAG: RNB domain-containing ribonuclease [Cyanobacteriota bacterium]|nr:RNB domain-containing ribonuclease [Cyanobacteriota bacterium]
MAVPALSLPCVPLSPPTMKFTVADLLDQLSTSEIVAPAQLDKALGLTDAEDQRKLRIGLAALERLALVEQAEDGLRRCDSPDLIPARLRCSSKGFCFALRDDAGEDIYIRDHQLNHAWNGDRVLVRITREGGRRRSPEGSVQCILRRHTTRMLGHVERQGERLVALPLDDRLLTTVTLPETDATHLEQRDSHVVEVEIDRFPVAQFAPEGHVARSLSINGGDDADLELLLVKHQLQDDGSAPRLTLKAPVEKGRDDLTSLPSLLLRPWQAADAPALPALSLETRETGWRLWVHAPAVAERLGLATAVDTWMREQGEALPLGKRWRPLLPQSLAKACAFSPGLEQAALSVVLDLGPDGELEHYRFQLSRVRPLAAVDQAALEALAERKPKGRTLPAALKTHKGHLELLERLVELTAVLRQRRMAAGSLDLDVPPPPLEGLGDALRAGPDSGREGWWLALPEAHPAAILREAVLVAHRALGHHLAALGLPAIYAVNPPPDASAINEVAKAALALDIPLELSSEGNASAAELAAAFAHTDRSRVWQQQIRDTLAHTQLSEAPGAHALAGDPIAVVPWTCPSLHYADLFNQHLLTTLLTEGKDRPTVRHKTSVDLASDASHGAIDWPLLTPTQLAPFEDSLRHGLVLRLNGRRLVVAEFQADRLAMAQARSAEPCVGQTLQGVISGVQSYGFFVEVPPSMVEGLVHVSSLKDDWYEYRSRQSQLVGRKGRRTYMVGDPVEVVIEKVDVLRHQIDLSVVLPEDGAAVEADDDEDEADVDAADL